MSFGNLDEAKDAATAAATGFLGDIKQKMSKVRDDDAARLRSTDRPISNAFCFPRSRTRRSPTSSSSPPAPFLAVRHARARQPRGDAPAPQEARRRDPVRAGPPLQRRHGPHAVQPRRGELWKGGVRAQLSGAFCYHTGPHTTAFAL
eukprot:29249-Pelagococcus_subviridis.AAC.2